MEINQSKKNQFQKMVKESTPESSLVVDCIRAFIVGGLICIVGQILINTFVAHGFTKEEAGTFNAIFMIGGATLLTGIGIYDNIGKFAGAGSSVPITGFANAMAAPAIEHKREGFILGVGSKMFLIAGPVIVYGVITSMVCGAIYFVLGGR